MTTLPRACDAARRADDEHRVARLHPAVVAQALQGRQPGYRDDRGLLEGEVHRLVRQLALRSAGVLGVRALADAEHPRRRA
jgi:hypothetical protein